jgi:oligopeptide/dipeptide ABC transporter ATP-binding protein
VSAALLELEALTHRYRRSFTLEPLGLALDPGEVLGVVGESGSGKTTLARLVAGLIVPSGGFARFRGEPTHRLRGARRAALQMVFQDPFASLDPRQRALAAVAEPLAVHLARAGSAARLARAGAMLERLGIAAALYERYPHELSIGQCQRVALARALALAPALLVLDEPVSAQDLGLQSEVLALVAELARAGTACLVISHNLAAVRQVATRVLVLLGGRVLEQGPAAVLGTAPGHPYTRALLAAAPVADPQAPRAPPLPPAGVRPGLAACSYTARCAFAVARCANEVPALEGEEKRIACHRAAELNAR